MRTKCVVLFMAMAVLYSACTLCAPVAFGQAVYGSILGTVTDPQGAAVAGAKVTVTDQRKGTSDVVTTNADGNYSVTHLIPDTYTVRVEAPGFKTSEQKDVLVQADAGSRVDLQFQVGGASETVEVTAEAPQLKTDRADVAVSFNEKYVEDVPILTRRFIPNSKWQQFGGTIGGPIIKDKLFFFGDYQGTRQSNGVSGLFTVPTSTVLSTCNPATNTSGFCDLSQYLGVAPGGGQIYDPTTGDPNTGANRQPFGAQAGCTGNCIPIGLISPAAAKILALFPDPGATAPVLNNF